MTSKLNVVCVLEVGDEDLKFTPPCIIFCIYNLCFVIYFYSIHTTEDFFGKNMSVSLIYVDFKGPCVLSMVCKLMCQDNYQGRKYTYHIEQAALFIYKMILPE